MVIPTPVDLLGLGLYSPKEAAFYARLPVSTVTRWLYGTRTRRAAIRPQVQFEEMRVVTFLDFIQTMAIRAIRLQHKVPLPKIRRAVELAQRELKVEYPFAMKHRTFLLGNELIIRRDDDNYVQLSGKGAKNLVIKEVAEFYMIDLTFDPQGVARKYRAFAWRDYNIEMDPAVRFGEPIVKPSGYTARALWEAVQSEGSMRNAAEAYGVSDDEVQTAWRYYDHLKAPAA